MHALFVILDQSERAFYLPHLIKPGVAIAQLRDKIISVVLTLWTTSSFSLPAKWKNWEVIDASKFRHKQASGASRKPLIMAPDESDRFAKLSSKLVDIVTKLTTKRWFRSESKKARNWEAMDSTKFTYKQDWPVASELVPGGMHFHFCLQRARYDHPIRQKVPWENQWKKL